MSEEVKQHHSEGRHLMRLRKQSREYSQKHRTRQEAEAQATLNEAANQ